MVRGRGGSGTRKIDINFDFSSAKFQRNFVSLPRNIYDILLREEACMNNNVVERVNKCSVIFFYFYRCYEFLINNVKN